MLVGKGDAKKMELGKQIKKYRSEMNLSQEELADKVFVSRQTVSNWENDKNYPDIKSLLLLSEVFGVSLDIFYQRCLTSPIFSVSKGFDIVIFQANPQCYR